MISAVEWANLQNGVASVFTPILLWWVVMLVALSLVTFALTGVVFIIHQYGGRRAKRI